MALWIYIHFPRLALESTFDASVSIRPKLLLSAGNRKVVQCNDTAFAHGIEQGMALNTAYCLVPEVDVVTYDSEKERARLEQLALYCYRLSARISLQPPDGLLLEIGSMLKLFGGLQKYWDNLRRFLLETSFSFCLSTGHTPQTARVLARSNHAVCSSSIQEHQQALNGLKVSQLGLSDVQVKRFNSMGVRSYRELRQLPVKELGYRFGITLVSFLARFDQDSEVNPLFEIPLRFKSRTELNYEVAYSKGLLFPLKPVLQQLEIYLQLRQLQSDCLFLLLDHRSGVSTRLVIKAVSGAWKSKDWLELISIQLDQLRLAEPVISFQVRSHKFTELQQQAKDLLGSQHSDSGGDQLLSVMVSRLGHNRVCLPSANADPRPEYAGKLQGTSVLSLPCQQSYIKPHPALLTPQNKCRAIKSYQVINGPERVVSGWWDAHQFRSDFYSARSNVGEFNWLVREDTGNWFCWGGYG